MPTLFKTTDLKQAKEMLTMIDEFEDHDDVQAVYHNLEMTDELVAFLGEA